MPAPTRIDRDGKCPECKRGLKIGDLITRWEKIATRDGREVNVPRHNCKDPRGEAEGASPPNDPPPQRAVGPGEPPLYTYDRTLKLWSQGLQVGEVKLGVSVRGRPLLSVEIADVDQMVREASKRNETGDLRK